MKNKRSIISQGKKTIKAEAAALVEMAARVNGRFAETVQTLLAARGKVIVTGMGKSGLIGQKIADRLHKERQQRLR